VAPELVPIFSQVVADRFASQAKPALAPVARPFPAPAVAPPPPQPRASRLPAAPAAAPAAHRDPLEPQEAARRLARVMVSSIEGGDRNDQGASLAAAIAEARELFQSCVLPELAHLFEEALAARGLLEPTPTPVHAPPPPPVRSAPPLPPVRSAPWPPPVRSARPPPPQPLAWETTTAVEPDTSGDATDRVMVPPDMDSPAPEVPMRLASPEDDLPTRLRPGLPEPEPVRAPPVKAMSGRLIALTLAITATGAGIVYYLLMAR
jgi:hypothetical protein